MKYDLKIRDSQGNILEAVQELPEKGDKFPTVVMVPGFGVDLHEYGLFDDISDELVRHGFGTFRFSFEGTGKSEGDFVDMTLDKQAQQLRDVLKYVKKDRFTNKKKIGVLAQSIGCASVVATLPIKGIKTYLFTSAPAYPGENLARWFKRQRGYNPEGISQRERSDNRITKIGPQFWQNIETHDLVNEIKQLDKPILFIHGGKDKLVKYFEAEDYFNAVKSRKKLSLIEMADHGYTRDARPKLVELVTQWFDENLR